MHWLLLMPINKLWQVSLFIVSRMQSSIPKMKNLMLWQIKWLTFGSFGLFVCFSTIHRMKCGSLLLWWIFQTKIGRTLKEFVSLERLVSSSFHLCNMPWSLYPAISLKVNKAKAREILNRTTLFFKKIELFLKHRTCDHLRCFFNCWLTHF